MTKEIKKENKKVNGIYWGVAAIFAVLALFVILQPKNNTDTAETTEVVVAESVEPQEEKTVARIDFSTKLVDADKPQFEIYVDGSDVPEKQASWMAKNNNQGYVVQKNANNVDIVVKALDDNDINLALRGPDKRDENNQFVPVWVKYTSFTVNGKEILPEAVELWHNKPFRHTINAKAGEEYKIHAEWTEADAVPEE